MTFHWMNKSTGEIRRNLWEVIYGDVRDFFWCIKKRCPLIPHKWHYSRKGW